MSRMSLGSFVAASIFCILLSFPIYPQNPKTAAVSTVGPVKGAPITMDDLTKAAANDLQQVEIQRIQSVAFHTRAKHPALEQALAQIIEDRILDAEAASRGLTKQASRNWELAGKVKEPTLEDLDAHYTPDKRFTGDSRDKMFARMKPYLGAENHSRAKAE